MAPEFFDPYRNFRYSVTITPTDATGAPNNSNDIKAGFSKISGIKQAADEILYREGNYSFGITHRKIPGIVKYDDVTFSRGFSKDSDQLIQWSQKVSGVITADADGITTDGKKEYRATITINIYDKGSPIDTAADSNKAVRTITLFRAWPRQIEISGFEGKGSDVIIKNMVVAHEGVHWGTHKERNNNSAQ
ncbi:MAG: phage tail protein [Thermoplasmata archaeon]